MHKFLYYILPLLLMLAGATSCSSDDGPDAPPEPSVSVSRTVLVYMIANNNLGSSYHSDERDIQEMLKGVEGGKLDRKSVV